MASRYGKKRLSFYFSIRLIKAFIALSNTSSILGAGSAKKRSSVKKDRWHHENELTRRNNVEEGISSRFNSGMRTTHPMNWIKDSIRHSQISLTIKWTYFFSWNSSWKSRFFFLRRPTTRIHLFSRMTLKRLLE